MTTQMGKLRRVTANVSVCQSHHSDSFSTDEESTMTKHPNSWRWSRMMSLRSTKNKLEADEPSPQHDVAFLSSFLVQFVVHPLTSFGRPPLFHPLQTSRGSQQQDVPPVY